MTGKVVAIYICPAARAAMQHVLEATAIAGAGLEGDRYATNEGSWSKNAPPGNRQVTLINAAFFPGSGYEFVDPRRNIITHGVELNRLIGREFRIGGARMRGVKYCFPCNVPNKPGCKPFPDAFHDCGGIIAEVVEGGTIRTDDTIIPEYAPEYSEQQ